ncbi:hypothetical protein HP934_000796 [Enterococcus faecalis]|nr:hypothetical protein [Enterococcus faecalis]
MYITIHENYEAREMDVYTILGIDVARNKEILGLWLNQIENKNQWMKSFDELKTRGVEDIFFLSIDGVSGFELGVKAVFPEVTFNAGLILLMRLRFGNETLPTLNSFSTLVAQFGKLCTP